MITYRKALGARLSTTPIILQGKQAATITVNATTPIGVGVPPYRAYISRVNVVCSTVPADSDGTILATLKKYDASADAAVSLSSALDLETLTANEGSNFTLTSTLTDAQRTFDAGDFLYVDVVNNSAAIDTQPVNLIFTAEFFELE